MNPRVRPQLDPVRLSTAGGLLAMVLWSSTFALARSLSEQLGPLTAGAAVYLTGGAFCLLRLAVGRMGWRSLGQLPRPYLFGCGFLFAAYTVLIYLAVGTARTRNQLLEVALINYLWPAGTILLSIPVLRHRARWSLWPATLVALAGVFLVLTQGTELSWSGVRVNLAANPAAYTMALLAALAWALYSNLARRWARPGGAGAVEWFVPATGLLLLGARFLVSEPTLWTARAVAEAFALGAVTALAYALWDQAMRRGNLLLVAVCSYFTPLLSTLASSAYLGVTPSPVLWAGSALLVAGSLASWRSVSSLPAAFAETGAPRAG
jgi:drug/metabolite transporter (DMT)-like permease